MLNDVGEGREERERSVAARPDRPGISHSSSKSGTLADKSLVCVVKKLACRIICDLSTQYLLTFAVDFRFSVSMAAYPHPWTPLTTSALWIASKK